MFENNIHYKAIKHKAHKYIVLMITFFEISRYKNLMALEIDHEFYAIRNGVLTAKVDYMWDGPSGPTRDDKTNIRASLPHDIIYQAIGEQEKIKKLSLWKKYRIRREADKLFKRVLKEDGMGWFRRQGYFIAVRGFGAFFAHW